jgi:uncharacterized membrane protein YphA (DoxX/SURF4 family)
MEIKTIILWVLLIAFVIPLFLHGFQKVFGKKDKADLFRRLGYPLWFMRVIGLAEIIGCTLLLFSQTRFYGAAIFPIILLSAFYSHLRIKDKKGDTMTPLFVGLHLVVIVVFTLWIK